MKNNNNSQTNSSSTKSIINSPTKPKTGFLNSPFFSAINRYLFPKSSPFLKLSLSQGHIINLPNYSIQRTNQKDKLPDASFLRPTVTPFLHTDIPLSQDTAFINNDTQYGQQKNTQRSDDNAQKSSDPKLEKLRLSSAINLYKKSQDSYPYAKNSDYKISRIKDNDDHDYIVEGFNVSAAFQEIYESAYQNNALFNEDVYSQLYSNQYTDSEIHSTITTSAEKKAEDVQQRLIQQFLNQFTIEKAISIQKEIEKTINEGQQQKKSFAMHDFLQLMISHLTTLTSQNLLYSAGHKSITWQQIMTEKIVRIVYAKALAHHFKQQVTTIIDEFQLDNDNTQQPQKSFRKVRDQLNRMDKELHQDVSGQPNKTDDSTITKLQQKVSDYKDLSIHYITTINKLSESLDSLKSSIANSKNGNIEPFFSALDSISYNGLKALLLNALTVVNSSNQTIPHDSEVLNIIYHLVDQILRTLQVESAQIASTSTIHLNMLARSQTNLHNENILKELTEQFQQTQNEKEQHEGNNLLMPAQHDQLIDRFLSIADVAMKQTRILTSDNAKLQKDVATYIRQHDSDQNTIIKLQQSQKNREKTIAILRYEQEKYTELLQQSMNALNHLNIQNNLYKNKDAILKKKLS